MENTLGISLDSFLNDVKTCAREAGIDNIELEKLVDINEIAYTQYVKSGEAAEILQKVHSDEWHVEISVPKISMRKVNEAINQKDYTYTPQTKLKDIAELKSTAIQIVKNHCEGEKLCIIEVLFTGGERVDTRKQLVCLLTSAARKAEDFDKEGVAVWGGSIKGATYNILISENHENKEDVVRIINEVIYKIKEW